MRGRDFLEAAKKEKEGLPCKLVYRPMRGESADEMIECPALLMGSGTIGDISNVWFYFFAKGEKGVVVLMIPEHNIWDIEFSLYAKITDFEDWLASMEEKK